MRVIFHEKYKQVYSHDPAAKVGRMESIAEAIGGCEFIQPEPATEEDILLRKTGEEA